MIKSGISAILLLIIPVISCQRQTTPMEVSSPDNINKVVFWLSSDGTPGYLVKHGNETVIDSSSMSFDLRDQPSLKNGFHVKKTSSGEVNETWEMPWGEQQKVKNHYRELVVELEETEAPHRRFNVHFKVYDDGIGFRYEFLPQEGVDSLVIMEENTEFQLTGDHLVWWIPGDWDSYEHLYKTTRVSGINAIKMADTRNLIASHIPLNAVNTPVTMRTSTGLHLSFHEANLTDYAGMTLKVDTVTFKLTSELVGSDRLGYKVKRALPFNTPWRTIQIADKATQLIQSKLILNLNEPNKLGDIPWFRPMKYIGIWWEMHIGKSTWDYGMTRDENGHWVDTGKAHGRHGATTENARRYIDFAAENRFGGVLIEGWNTGWEKYMGPNGREGAFDFVTPYPDYDLAEVSRYAKEKGIQIIMHHETTAAPRTYEQQLDTAYKLMNRYDIHAVKTGYVGKIIPEGEYHHGQWMVRHYRKVLETAAKYRIAVDVHEPIKATGIRRTYPNAIAREGLRGQEFNAWAVDGGNPPEHTTIVAFTRMLAGPIDFTPGVFDISLPTKENNQINTTLAKQLALYVVIYSPIQMACDLPENYKGNPAFQFIRDVGVNWEQTLVLDGEVGDFVTIARQERGTGNWFIGSITDENKRQISINFDFLDEGKTYRAAVYMDGKDADYRNNPTSVDIEHFEIKKGASRTFELAAGGGLAISLLVTVS